MEVDALYKQLGNPGRFHVCIYILLFLDWLPVNNNHLNMAFYGAVPQHHCRLPDGFSPNESIPVVVSKEGETSFDSCRVYVNHSAFTNKTVACTDGWTYNTELGERTIATEWDLVCGRAYMTNLATTIYFIGVMVGGIVFGTLADRFGRRPMLLITLYVPIGLGVGLYFVPSYTLFVIVRFFLGAFLQGLEISSFVLVMELFQPRDRTIAGCIIMLSYALGNMWISLLSYLLKDWRYIQLAISLPTLLMLCQIWVIPESPRWLLANNKFKEVKLVFLKAAKFNKTRYPEDMLGDEKIQLLMEKKAKEEESTHAQPQVTHSFVDLFRTPRLRKISLILFFIWFVMNLGYYGLSFNIATLAGNKYLNFFIGAALEIPAYLIASFATLKLGRRRPLCAYFVIGGFSCIIAGCIPQTTGDGTNLQWLSTSFALLGRFGMASVICVMFLYTSELFPTVIRNIGVGCCAFCTRFGGVIAPQILHLGYYTYREVPVIVFGCLALVASGTALFLPETMGRHLPDTIEDAETYGLHDNRGKDREEIIVVDDYTQSML